MSVAIRQARESDLTDLLELMREFYGPQAPAPIANC